MQKQKRVLGMLLGHHAGEALGVTLEFGYPVKDLSHRDIIGRPPELRAGQATDDLEMTIAVLQAIENIRSIDVETVKKNFIEWYLKGPIDIGLTVRRGIQNLISGNADGGTHESDQGNGSLMRCSPLAILEVSDQELWQIVSHQTRLTHCSSACVEADVLYLKLLRKILNGATRLDALDFMVSSAECNTPISSAIVKGWESTWDQLPCTGWVLDGISSIVWALKNCDSYEEAVIAIANRGGDADTNAAIVGSVFGALYGDESIPERWLVKLEETKKIERHLTKLAPHL
ncbi:MAG: ADP-ribosylglycohydrolase family protein [Bdellovibrionaceae bacterium]|nr:ADP-ribosylglycohydrolase family protein [Pseudobdellovibrionaceae bacterium]